MFSDVLSCFLIFSAGLEILWITTPFTDIFSRDALNWSLIFYKDSQMCLRCAQMFPEVHRCFQMTFLDFVYIFYRCPHDVFWMFSGYLQDFSRRFSGCSDGSYGPGGIWWSFQMKVWTLIIQRNLMIPNYWMIPAIRWSNGIMDFGNP